MTVDRRWPWVGGILAVTGGALALGVPLATVITIAAVLACPAAMYFGMCAMGMMGRSQGGAETARSASPDGRGAPTAKTVPPVTAAAVTAPSRAPAATLDGSLPVDDPVMILKRRLAAGDISLDEYDRLLAAVSRPESAPSATRQGTSG